MQVTASSPTENRSQATSYLFTSLSPRKVRSIVDTLTAHTWLVKMDAFSWGESHKIVTPLLDGRIILTTKGSSYKFLLDSWSVPFALSCICLFLQIIYILLHWINTFRKPYSVIETEPSLIDTTTSTFSHSLQKKVKSYGGWTIYLFLVARLFGCLVLFALSVDPLLRCQRNHSGVDTVFKHLFAGCPEGFVTLTFVNLFPSSSFETIPDIMMIDSSSTAL